MAFAEQEKYMSYIRNLYSIYFAPRGNVRMGELGMQIAQQYLRPMDKLIGIVGEAGAGKSMMVKGMFPGLELTNDDEGVNIRPLPLLELVDDPLAMIKKSGMSLFATPHTYHIDIRFEQGFTPLPKLAEAITTALDKGKRVVVEHFDLVYPFLKTPESENRPINADLIIGIGEEVIVTRPDLFGPVPQDIYNIVSKSIKYRKMVHSAEDITCYFLSHGLPKNYEHADIKHGFLLCFKEKPMVSLEMLEKKVNAVIEENLPISFYDDDHITIGDNIVTCAAPRNHVKSTGEIEDFKLIKEIPYDPVRKCYLVVGMVGQKEAPKIGEDIDKIERVY